MNRAEELLKIDEIKSSGKSIEECIDDLVIWELSRTEYPNQLAVTWILIKCFNIKLFRLNILVEEKFREIEAKYSSK
jgi:hypothetical protein